MALLFALSSVPDTGEESLGRRILFPSPTLQNLLHVPAYALLTWLWSRALRQRGWRTRPAILTAAAVAIAYGALDEVHQYFVPGRFASVTDALLNAAGAAAVLVAVRIAGR
jgi:VanZ family protein